MKQIDNHPDMVIEVRKEDMGMDVIVYSTLVGTSRAFHKSEAEFIPDEIIAGYLANQLREFVNACPEEHISEVIRKHEEEYNYDHRQDQEKPR